MALVWAPKCGWSMACWMSSRQSISPARLRVTNWMMVLPPGEPSTASSSPLCLNTIVGDIELRGRLPASTRLATGRPASSLARKEKSVSWLLSRKPRTSWKLPKADSMEVVIDTALPPASTIETWLVDGSGWL